MAKRKTGATDANLKQQAERLKLAKHLLRQHQLRLKEIERKRKVK